MELQKIINIDNFNFEVPFFKSYSEIIEKEGKKEETGNFYVEGIIATTQKDTVNDVITKQALEEGLQYLQKYTTVLFNHDHNRPIGKIVEASLISLGQDDTGKEHFGIKIKALISKTEKEIIEKIKEGVLSKFSIGASGKIKPVFKDENNEEIDHFEIISLKIFECSIVSVPANPNATIENIIMKHLKDLKEINKNIDKGGQTMSETTIQKEQKKPSVTINRKDVDYKPWSQVNKIELARILFESGNTSAIKEAFGVVPDINKRSTWKFPHHVLKNKGDSKYELVLSYTGLMAAYKAFRGARRKPKLTPDQSSSLKSHLRKHFRFLVSEGIYDEVPEALKSLMNTIEIIDKDLEEKELTEEENKALEKLFAEVLDTDTLKEIDNVIKEFDSEEETDKACRTNKKEDKEKEKSLEIEDIELYNLIKKAVIDALKYLDLETINKDVNKNLEKEKEDKTMAEKDINKDIEKDTEKTENLEKNIDINEKILKTLEDFKKELDNLKKEIEEIKNQPVIKGQDTQRENEKDKVSLEDFIKSSEFDKLPLEKKLEILGKLYEKANK